MKNGKQNKAQLTALLEGVKLKIDDACGALAEANGGLAIRDMASANETLADALRLLRHTLQIADADEEDTRS